MKRSRGMTLIEMVVAIVLMGIAMVAYTAFLVPQIRDSAMPHYQTRAAALGQSFMSQILARGFDHQSDFDGGMFRCGETDWSSCTLPGNLGPETGETQPGDFNDVDDYIGCWSTPTTLAQCSGESRGNISDVLDGDGENSVDDYRNFRIEVTVAYDALGEAVTGAVPAYKTVTVTIHASNAQSLSLTAVRGNY